MHAFKHTITINKTELVFCFSKIAGCTLDKYFVEVLHGDRLVTTFDMAKEETAGWKILPPAREWIIEMKKELAAIANQHQTWKKEAA